MAADALGMTETVDGHRVTYTFSNRLRVCAEISQKDHPLRILPITRLQQSVLNYLLNFPEVARGKEVFEPFAGSGVLGFMALAAGAERVDFLDINPRAAEFQQETVSMNGFPPGSVRHFTADLADFTPPDAYDLILANPPFLPTPACIEGTLTSNGGADGNRLLGILLTRLTEFLRPEGQALIILFQLVADGTPLAARLFAKHLQGRDVEFSALQELPISFDAYCEAYERQHPSVADGIREWASVLRRRFGGQLCLSHYVMHIGGRREGNASMAVRFNCADKFGDKYVIPADDPDFAPVDGRRR
jgi:hypothetical protein